jgi:exonuclease I
VKTTNFKLQKIVDVEPLVFIGKVLGNSMKVKASAKWFLANSEIYVVFDMKGDIKYILEIREKRVLQCRGYMDASAEVKDVPEIRDVLLSWGVIVDSQNNNFN